MEISDELYKKLDKLGLIPNEVREGNVGESNYSQHIIQPWSIWQDWELNPWDADIVKRVLRTKQRVPDSFIKKLVEKVKAPYFISDLLAKEDTEARIEDYKKIIHICNERIRQLNDNYGTRRDSTNN